MHKIEGRSPETARPPHSPTSRDDDPMRGIVIGSVASICFWALIYLAFSRCT